MATTQAARQVNCPKCATAYKLRSDFQGSTRCKKCQTVFSVGLSGAERAGARSRDSQDHKTAIRLTVACSVALLVLAGIIYMASKTDSGTVKPGSGSRTRSEYSRSTGSNPRKSRPAPVPTSPHPPVIASRFARAMSEGDKDTLADLFLFDWYFDWADKRFGRIEDGEDYASGTPEYQAEQRELVLEQLMDPDRAEFMKRLLLPQIEAGEDWVWAAKKVQDKDANIQFRCKDEKGNDLFIIFIGVRLKKGLTAEDGARESSWGVYKVADQWFQKTLTVAKPEKRLVDAGIGRHNKEIIRVRKSSAKGPPESAPKLQDPIAGTGEGQKNAVQTAIRVILDPGSSGPDYFRAQDQLKAMGKLAIPFLLNILLDKDHGNDEGDIMTAHKAILVLKDITGMHFGYGPGKAKMAMQNMITATPEERERAVRRWFGWWKLNKRSWKERAVSDDEDKDDEDK